MDQPVLGWGRTLRYEHDIYRVDPFDVRPSSLYAPQSATVFHGLGRSYGDVALNNRGALCQTRHANNFLKFDRCTGLVKAQSGLTIAELNAVTIPYGWIIPVSPGTKYVTLGGAVANDVHGKNHHSAGSIGTHIKSLKIVRSDGEELVCSRTRNSELFAATISGLGLTGYIAWIEIQLKTIASTRMCVENIRYPSLNAFYELDAASVDWPYTAAWVDCFSSARHAGSGIYTRARFMEDGDLTVSTRKAGLHVFRDMPAILLNKYTISTFNWMYKRLPRAKSSTQQWFQNVIYPLDHITSWNRLYGRAGFYQHQSIVPIAESKSGITELLNLIKASGQGSFLAVLKRHGRETSPGLNSFSLDGVSLALDFPNRGAKTLRLLDTLDRIVIRHGGRMYPAKDATMSAEAFQTSYPNWRKLEALRDPKISSSFWRRVANQNA